MPLRTEIAIAVRYLRPKRTESFITLIGILSMIGIALGVATLIIVMSVMNGFRVELLSHIIGLNGHISVYQPGQGAPDYAATLKTIQSVPSVTSVIPQIEKQVLMQVRDRARGAVIRGIREEDFAARPSLLKGLTSGALGNFRQGQVIIGADLADDYGLNIGDKVRFLSPTASKTPFGLVPRAMVFTVGGFFRAGLQQYDGYYAFIPLEKAQAFFGYAPTAVDSLEITLDNAEAVTQAKGDLATLLPTFWVARDWKNMNASFFNALEVERTVMFIILTLITIIATFIIVATLFMLVKAKSRDIGVLRTLGLTPGGIMRIFMMTGSTIGVLGTTLGFSVGVLFSKNIESIRRFIERVANTDLFSKEIYFLSKITAILDWNEVGLVVGIALFFSLLATLYPARKAARLDPVEVIRNE
jgi:lipoprotein-releasing system permease protein